MSLFSNLLLYFIKFIAVDPSRPPKLTDRIRLAPMRSSSSCDLSSDTSFPCEEEEVEEITEAEVLRHLDAQEAPLQVTVPWTHDLSTIK